MLTAKKSVIWLAMQVMFLCVAVAVAAQTNMGFQYFYDDLGQLTKVVDSTGTAIEYVYDPVGNILQIKRSTVAPGTLAIFDFTPQRGGPGQIVTIQGQAFDPTVTNNTVQFNGSNGSLLSASPTTLTASVPPEATTGPISVTVAGQTVTTTFNFTVLPIPVITSLSRKSALLGSSFPNAQFPALTVTGINLIGSTFALAPATAPPAAAFGTPAVNASGTSATMSLAIGTSATGTFAVVATNPAGSSSAVPAPTNRFTIVNPRSTADTDGNGVPDVVKALFGVDVLDPTAFPPPLPSMFGQAESPAFTVVNASTGVGKPTLTAESPAFTILNGSSRESQTTFQTESPAFTVVNSSSATSKVMFTAESPAFTVENSISSRSGAQTFTVEGPFFSLLNGSSPSATAVSAESSFFSLLNNQTSGALSGPLLAARNVVGSSSTKAQRARQALPGKRTRKRNATKPVKAARTKSVLPGGTDAQSNVAAPQNEIQRSTLSVKKELPHVN